MARISWPSLEVPIPTAHPVSPQLKVVPRVDERIVIDELSSPHQWYKDLHVHLQHIHDGEFKHALSMSSMVFVSSRQCMHTVGSDPPPANSVPVKIMTELWLYARKKYI